MESKGKAMNNTERELWVMNDEQLYGWYKSSRIILRRFIKANQEIIDGVIKYRLECGENYEKN